MQTSPFVISIENRLVVSRVPLPQAPWTGFAAPSRLLRTAWESPPITLDGALVPVAVDELDDGRPPAPKPFMRSCCGSSTTVSQLVPKLPKPLESDFWPAADFSLSPLPLTTLTDAPAGGVKS